MTKLEVKEILRFFASKEFDYVPSNEEDIDVIFSEEFNNKMKRIIEKLNTDTLSI